MKKFLASALNKVAEVANDVATYNAQHGPVGAPPDKSSGSSTRPGETPAGKNAPNDPVIDFLLRNVRSAHVRRAFAKTPTREFTKRQTVKIMVGSYNVNGKPPPADLTVHEWLSMWKESWPKSEDGHEGADIVAVGFQEIVPLSVTNAMGVAANLNVEGWDRAIAATLNGEDWANKQFGPSIPGSIVSTAANPVAAAMEAGWRGFEPGQVKPGLSAGPGDEGKYIQVASKQMLGIYLTVWVRKALLPHVRGVQVTAVATGFGGYIGNKGAVCARLRVYDSSLVLISSHLSSGEAEGDDLRRHNDVAEILRRATFSAQPEMMTSSSAALISASLGGGHWGSARSIADHENAIWVGDLNYRLACGDEEAHSMIRSGQIDALLEHDELVNALEAKKVFQEWREGPITFPPTFKFKVGTNTYLGHNAGLANPAIAAVAAVAASASSATSSRGVAASLVNGGVVDEGGGAEEEVDEEVPVGEAAAALTAGATPAEEKQKRRTPAWCDRILWIPDRELGQLAYGRSDLALSDHKPVAAAFLMEARHYDRAKIEELLDAARRSVEVMQQTMRPKCRLEPNVVQIGAVQLGQEVQATVQLNNSGGVEGFFHWVPPPSVKGSGSTLDDDVPALPCWLTSDPLEGTVEPGSSRTLQLTIMVDGGPKGSAGTLSSAENDFLDAIVILRVEDGSDMFCSITGSYIRSALGQDLPRLAGYGPTPIAPSGSPAHDAITTLLASPANLAFNPLSQPEASTSSSGSVPKEVQSIIDLLLTPASLSTPHILTSSIQSVLGMPSADPLPPADSRIMHKELHQALAPYRCCLDLHRALPESVQGHPVAALLLLLLCQLPCPLLPQAAADVCGVGASLSPEERLGLATSVLQTALAPAERAVLNALLDLFRKVLHHSASNLVSTEALCKLLAHFLFPNLPRAATTAGADVCRWALLEVLLDPQLLAAV